MSENINEPNWNLISQFSRSNGNTILLDTEEFPNLIVKRASEDGKLNLAAAVKAYKAANDYPCSISFAAMPADIDPFGDWHDEKVARGTFDGRQILFASDEELKEELDGICHSLGISTAYAGEMKEVTRSLYAAIDAFIPGVEWVGPVNGYFKQDFGAIPAPVREISQLDAEER